jgi:hypothetical protein
MGWRQDYSWGGTGGHAGYRAVSASCWVLTMPWTVTRVELNVKDQRVDVWAGHEAGVQWLCPLG